MENINTNTIKWETTIAIIKHDIILLYAILIGATIICVINNGIRSLNIIEFNTVISYENRFGTIWISTSGIAKLFMFIILSHDSGASTVAGTSTIGKFINGSIKTNTV